MGMFSKTALLYRLSKGQCGNIFSELKCRLCYFQVSLIISVISGQDFILPIGHSFVLKSIMHLATSKGHICSALIRVLKMNCSIITICDLVCPWHRYIVLVVTSKRQPKS